MASKAKSFFTGLGLGAAHQATKEVISRRGRKRQRTEADILRDLNAAIVARDEVGVNKYRAELDALRRENPHQANKQPAASPPNPPAAAAPPNPPAAHGRNVGFGGMGGKIGGPAKIGDTPMDDHAPPIVNSNRARSRQIDMRPPAAILAAQPGRQDPAERAASNVRAIQPIPNATPTDQPSTAVQPLLGEQPKSKPATTQVKKPQAFQSLNTTTTPPPPPRTYMPSAADPDLGRGTHTGTAQRTQALKYGRSSTGPRPADGVVGKIPRAKTPASSPPINTAPDAEIFPRKPFEGPSRISDPSALGSDEPNDIRSHKAINAPPTTGLTPEEIESGIQSVAGFLGENHELVSTFLREIAAVESNLGLDPNTWGEGKHGGAFQIDPVGFKATQDTKSHPDLAEKHRKVKEKYGIDWMSMTREQAAADPIYSAIAARLYLSTFSDKIPKTKKARARWWKENYNTTAGKGSVERYLEAISNL